MPIVRKCLYCNKKLLTSSYGLMKHMGECPKVPLEIRNVFSGKLYNSIKNNSIKNNSIKNNSITNNSITNNSIKNNSITNNSITNMKRA